MKKNERITQSLKPQIDKLKKQYANDKQALQQEQTRLQRASGFSFVATCLPAIITMIIFFTFFAGMRNISQYEEFKQYVDLYGRYSDRYTQLTGLNVMGSGTMSDDYNDSDFDTVIEDWATANKLSITAPKTAEDRAYAAYSKYGSFKDMNDEYVTFRKFVTFFSSNPVFPAREYTESALFYNPNDLKGRFDIGAVFGYEGTKTHEAEWAKEEIINSLNTALKEKDWGIGRTEYSGSSTLTVYDAIHSDYLKVDAATELGRNIETLKNLAEISASKTVYLYYKDNMPSFLWVKSLWVADAPWKDAVPSFSTFRKDVVKYFDSNSGKLSDEVLNDLDSETTYNKVMLEIWEHESLYHINGYLFLAIISVGLSLLSQFIMSRQQRRSGQTAMGAGGSMKMMMLIMPAMTAIFAVMYTSAFTLYMITSSAMTLVINLFTGAIIGKILRSKEREELSEAGVVRYGRRDPNDYLDDKRSKK